MPNFFEIKKPKQFDFKPRYYSEEKERIEELKRRVGEEKAEEEFRSDRIREAFQQKRPLKNNRKGLLSGSKLLVYAFFVILLIMLISSARWLLF